MIRRIVRWIKCKCGYHGIPQGGFQVLRYDVHARIFRYDSYLQCPHCFKRIG
jgi:hypothetical protein